MNKLLALTKIQIYDFFSKYKEQLNAKNKVLGTLALALPLLFLLPAVQLGYTMVDTFARIGFPELSITYMYTGSVMMMFLAGIPFLVSNFFYAKDLKFLASLPVKEDTIIFSKLASVYVYLLAINCLILGPTVVIYSTQGGLKLLSLFMGILALIIAPLIPMILSTLIIIPFMSFLGKGKKRNMLVVLGNLVLLVGILALQLGLSRVQMDPEAFQQLALQKDGLLHLIGRRFPPSIWMTKMIQGSVIQGVLFILLNGALILLLKMVSTFLYGKALLFFNQEGGTTIEKGTLTYEVRGKGMQIIKRHILMIVSNPTFFLNTVLTMFVPILVLVLASFTGEISRETFAAPMVAPYIGYIYALTITMPGLMGSLSATAISREGKCFWETRVLPISARDNINYRVITTLMINYFASFILAILAGIYLPLSPAMILGAVLFCVTATLFFSTFDIIINIERPLLNWSSPTAAVKNNLNVMLSIMSRIIIAVPLYILYRIMPKGNVGMILAVLGGIFFILYLGTVVLIGRVYEEKFTKIIP